MGGGNESDVGLGEGREGETARWENQRLHLCLILNRGVVRGGERRRGDPQRGRGTRFGGPERK